MQEIKFLQFNIGRVRDAQSLLKQTARERRAGVLLISEQYRKPENCLVSGRVKESWDPDVQPRFGS